MSDESNPITPDIVTDEEEAAKAVSLPRVSNPILFILCPLPAGPICRPRSSP